MEITAESLQERYKRMETLELIEMRKRGSLTELAMNVLDNELKERGVTDDMQAKTESAIDNASKKSRSWDWIWPYIVGVIIIKLFGIAGGLVTFGAYHLLKPRLGTWGAVAASGVIGVVAAIGLLAMLRA